MPPQVCRQAVKMVRKKKGGGGREECGKGGNNFRPNKNSINITLRETCLSAPPPGCGEV